MLYKASDEGPPSRFNLYLIDAWSVIGGRCRLSKEGGGTCPQFDRPVISHDFS